MTAPFSPNFGSVQAAPLARGPEPSRGLGDLGEFAQLLMAFRNAGEERAARREQLDNARRALDSNLDTDKLTRKKTERELEIAELRLDADAYAEPYARRMTTTPDLTADKVSEIIGEALQHADRKQLPYIVESITRQASGHQKLLTEIAQRQGAEVDTKVATATAPARIRAGKLAGEAAEAALAGQRYQNTLTRIQTAGYNRSSADTFLRNGMTWGEVRRAMQIPRAANDLPDDWTMPDAADSKAGAGQQAAFAASVVAANGQINALGNAGISDRAYKLLSGAGTGGLWKAFTDGRIAASLDEDDNALMTAYSAWNAPISNLMIKGSSSEGDVSRMTLAYITRASDPDKVKKQKAIIRNGMTLAFDTADPVAGVARFDKFVKDAGIKSDDPLLEPYNAVRDQVLAGGKKKRGAGGSDSTTVAPPLDRDAALRRQRGFGTTTPGGARP